MISIKNTVPFFYHFMEKIIIIGLLIAIILILLDRRFPVNVRTKDRGNTKKSPPPIMGDIKQTKKKRFAS
jgi:hypothetical protein